MLSSWMKRLITNKSVIIIVFFFLLLFPSNLENFSLNRTCALVHFFIFQFVTIFVHGLTQQSTKR
ncbi:hypothetical protein BCV71DRAFT_130271 [Rhizopus microsporus]|uniref:Uncharacterized protein n=1 Tax=Rhizopus microsporus TaxID=58291 RepID=A0A1X0RZJ1_RHIZD|nr:hypothetical protein BCV71DRAFT_130271 [Rhizopus microsporus]